MKLFELDIRYEDPNGDVQEIRIATDWFVVNSHQQRADHTLVETLALEGTTHEKDASGESLVTTTVYSSGHIEPQLEFYIEPSMTYESYVTRKDK